MKRTPIIDHDPAEPPVFEPGNLLDGARRQKGLPNGRVPAGCLLDMDGELVERLVASRRAAIDPTWPCFHTKLYRWAVAGGAEVGVIGGTVGAPFAVATRQDDFEKGGHDGQEEALELCVRALTAALAHARKSGPGKETRQPRPRSRSTSTSTPARHSLPRWSRRCGRS